MRIKSFGRTATIAVALALATSLGPAFVAPAEAAAVRTGSTEISSYVSAVYRDLLGRGPDADGLATWTASLRGGVSLSSVATSITSSVEYRARLINGTYREFLGRDSDPQGMETWQAQLRLGRTIQDIEAGFIASDEFYARAGGTPSGWVSRLYETVLKRSAGHSEISHWTNQLAAGASRSHVARGFVLSSERLARVIDGHYQTLLGRNIDPSGRTTWVTLIQQGNRIESIIGSIVSSAEYVRRVTGASSLDPTPVPTPAPNPAPNPTPSGSLPGAANTGIPDGTRISTVHEGDLTITTPGTVIDGWDIRGFVVVKAADVTIRNSIIRGGPASSTRSLVVVQSDAYSLTIEDSTLAATTASPHIDGIKGWNFTLRRVEITNVIDPVHLHGTGNVLVEHSWIHDNAHFTQDPNWGGTPSHDDSFQIQAGTNITIRNNTITGAHNAALMLTQDAGPVSNLTFADNFADGGACTINIKNTTRGAPTNVAITGNTFGRTTTHPNCAVLAPQAYPLTMTANTYTDGTPTTRKNG